MIEGAAGVEPDSRVVARHFEVAKRFDDAVAAYQKASVDARRRGAAMEACGYLSNALDQLALSEPGFGRDRTEITLRLERGLLMNAAQIGTVGEGPADFERCLELATTGGHEEELFSTLAALISYYMQRAELRRLRELLESLSARVTKDRPWSYPAIACSWGTLAFLEGDVTAAREYLLQALAESSAADPRELETKWWVAADPIAAAHIHLALTQLMCGDVDEARSDLTKSARRSDDLGYPKGDFGRAHTYFAGIWSCLEIEDTEQAATLVAALRSLSERAGLDMWQFVGRTEHATVKALAALNGGADRDTLFACAQNIALRVDASRQMHFNLYLTFHDAVIARLLLAAGQAEKARDRLDMSLQHAEETGMHFHDAELLRLRAHTLATPGAQRSALANALSLARTQGATLFELRCLLDHFELLEEGDLSALADVLSRFRGDTRWAERGRAEGILS